MIKRFASHYLFLSANKVYKQYIVELEDGLAFRFFPLEKEIHSVTWLGGVIILSTKPDYTLDSSMSFTQLITFLTLDDLKLPAYAYFLNVTDLQKDLLLPKTILRRLD